MNALIRITFSGLLLIVIQSFVSLAQPLSRESKKVKLAFDALAKTPKSRQKQLDYLKSFPQDKQQFIAVFDQNDFSELYSDSYEYITAFFKLSKYYPQQVMDKSINIGKDLKWNADAVGYLQHHIVILGNQQIKIFSTELRRLPESQVNGLITFLADVENHKAYSEYQQLINTLNQIGAKDLSDKFIKARSKREQEKND